MDGSRDTLRSFVSTILDDKRDFKSLEGPVLHYGIFLRQILNASRPDFMLQRDMHAPTKSTSGDALAPWHAAACMEDRTRTAAFIRGSIRAVERALEQSAHRPLHLIEAGCGPLGTLVLPLLAHFDSQELVVSLIDLHEESIACITSILDHFNFLPRVRQMVCGDASIVGLESPADLILTETMNTALSREPQVAISRSLIRKHRNAILIPQSIRIDCTLLDMESEMSHFLPQICEREILAPVFELTRKTAIELEEKDGLLPAARIRMPGNFTPGFAPWLTTTIRVFEDVQISDYQTQITYPVPLNQDDGRPIVAGATLQFAYRMGISPGVVFQLVEA